LLSVRSVQKRFGAVVALKDANLELMPGEIRALLGANGSGKSTLVKILSGLLAKDSGEILLDGQPLSIGSPLDSLRAGFATAYQDLSLVPRFTVAENIALGREPRGRAGLVERKQVLETALEILARLKAEFSPDTFTNVLDASQLGQVEIAKAFAWKARYLLLDEVTASLHHEQVKVLFTLLKEMAASGTAVLFVSHRLDEVFQLCHTATILRGGETVASVKAAEVDHTDLAFHMTGKRLDRVQVKKVSGEAAVSAEAVLAVENLTVVPKVKGVTLHVNAGEVVGLGGLQGQGQSECLQAVYGAIGRSGGAVRLKGTEVHFRSPAEALRHGLGFIPGDRDRDGVFPVRSVTENLFLAKLALRNMARIISPRELLQGARELIQRLGIVAGSPNHPARSLSGGNQQKLIVGRWLAVSPKVLILDDPTKGVDIGARLEIHEILRRMAQAGTSVLISSSEVEELLALADRIYVFYEGKVVEELTGNQRSAENLISAMLGVNHARGREG
jgi:ABC-type sugar transport system ATPase subunit